MHLVLCRLVAVLMTKGGKRGGAGGGWVRGEEGLAKGMETPHRPSDVRTWPV